MVLQIVDKPLLRRRLVRAQAKAVAGADFLQKRAATELLERLSGIERTFATAVVSGSVGDGFPGALLATGKAGSVFRLEAVAGAGRAAPCPAFVADEEALPLAPESLGLFVSVLSLQWANDLPGALVQVRRALRPDGLFLAVLTGGGTLSELRQSLFAAETELRGGASPRVLPAVELRDLGGLLQRAGFALPVVDRDIVTVRYASPSGLLADLRAMGATNALVERERTPMSRPLLLRAAELYARDFSDPDGRVRATFELLSLSGWAPHDSQQQPARRGSAKVSLASVLRPADRTS